MYKKIMSMYTRGAKEGIPGLYVAIIFVLVWLVMFLLNGVCMSVMGIIAETLGYSDDEYYFNPSSLIWWIYWLFNCIGGGLLCWWVARQKELKSWRFFICGFTGWPLPLSFLIVYPFIKSENKRRHYNYYALSLGLIFLILYLASLILAFVFGVSYV